MSYAQIPVYALAALILAAGFALAAWLIGRPEHPHRRPSRLAAAWWWCRDRAAWHWWRARMAAHRPRTWWAWHRYLHALGRENGRPGQPGKNMSDPAGLAGRGEPQGELAIARVAAPAGDARPSPALPPTVTDILPAAAIDAIIGYLAAGWAIYHELDGQRYDTGAFERITAGAP